MQLIDFFPLEPASSEANFLDFAPGDRWDRGNLFTSLQLSVFGAWN